MLFVEQGPNSPDIRLTELPLVLSQFGKALIWVESVAGELQFYLFFAGKRGGQLYFDDKLLTHALIIAIMPLGMRRNKL